MSLDLPIQWEPTGAFLQRISAAYRRRLWPELPVPDDPLPTWQDYLDAVEGGFRIQMETCVAEKPEAMVRRVRQYLGKRFRLARLMARVPGTTVGRALGWKDGDKISKIERGQMLLAGKAVADAATYFRCKPAWFALPRLDCPTTTCADVKFDERSGLAKGTVPEGSIRDLPIADLMQVAMGQKFLGDYQIETVAPAWVDALYVWNVLGPCADKREGTTYFSRDHIPGDPER